MTEKQIQNVN